MLHKNVETEQKRDVMIVLKDKKAKLAALKNEHKTTSFINYFKKESLSAKIQILTKEIAELFEQAIKEGFIKHDDPRLIKRQNDKLTMATSEVMKSVLFPYLAPPDFGRLSISSVTLYAQTAKTRKCLKALNKISKNIDFLKKDLKCLEETVNSNEETLTAINKAIEQDKQECVQTRKLG